MRALILCVVLLAGCKDRPAISTVPDAAVAVPGSQPLPEPNPVTDAPIKFRPQQKRVVVEPN